MKAAFLLAFLIIQTLLFANENSFRYLQPNDGLSSGEINHIAQDKEGRIWLATWTGLVSYDAYEFSNFRPILGDENSLPDKKIKQLFIDSKDHLWIATEKNLARMNLKNFQVETFSFDRSSNNPINILKISELSSLIIVHTVEGLFEIPVDVKNAKDKRVKKIQLYNKEQIIQPYLHLTASISNQVLLGAANSGGQNSSTVYFMKIRYRDKDTILSVDRSENIKGIVYNVSESKNTNELYFATNNGVYTYHPLLETFSKQVIFQGINTQNVIVTENNFLFASDDQPGLYYYNLGTNSSGRYLANPNQAKSILNSKVLTIFEDFSGTLWVGHQGQGISLLDLTRKEFLTIRRNPLSAKPLSSNTIMCFDSNKDYLLVGCRTGGINIAKFTDLTNSNVEFEVIPIKGNEQQTANDNGIWEISRQNDSVFWIGHNQGIHRLTKTKHSWQLKPLQLPSNINNYVRSIFIDKYQNLWCGTLKNGLLFIPNPEKNDQHKYYQFTNIKEDTTSLSDNVIIDIFLDSNERLWIGTNNGLNCVKGKFYNLDLSGLTRPNLSFERFVGTTQKHDYINNNEINCIVENQNGKIWIATQGGGINLYEPSTGKFSHLSKTEGLPGNDVFGILADNKNNLWISTEQGLAVYDQTTQSPKIKVYRSSDGIQSNVFLINSYHKSYDGRLFFGGENGFTTFYPEKIIPNTIAPKTIFTKLKILNKTYSIGDTIANNNVLTQSLNETTQLSLPYNKNTFSIGVAAIHFQNTEGNKIAYQLLGYQPDWKIIAASEKSIVFTKLPSGHYQLKAYAISSDNIPAEQIKTIDITILPPWYMTTFMIVIYLILSLAIITLIIAAMVNRQKQLYLQRLYNLNIENNESKMMYLANIAHELRTPLSLIISPIEDMIINKNEVRKRWHNHIQLIHRNSNYILKLIDQIIDFRKLDAGKLKLVKHNYDIVQIIKEVAFNFKAFENKQNVKLVLDLPDTPLNINIDGQKVEEVLYNLLSNAFKHTPEGHTIVISIPHRPKYEHANNTDLEYLYISVFNEGDEIPETDKDRIFERFFKANEKAEGAGIGLSFAKSLIEMHEGKIGFENIESKGVKFWITLPLLLANTLEEDIIQSSFVDQENKTPAAKSKILVNDESDEEIEKKTKVLIVEDNTDLREYLIDLLSRTYQCFEATDGEKGIKMVLSSMPDVIITDAIMPNVNGYTFVQKVKDNIKTCHIPIIMLTAKHTNDQIISGYEAGVDAYITKPFDTNVLLAQLSRLIKNRALIHQKYKQQNFMVEISSHNLSRDDIFLNNVKKQLEKNITNPNFNVSELSEEMQMSTTQLYRKIKSLTNYSPVEFMRITRLHRAHDLLAQKNCSIKEVCYQTGFNNFSYFVKCFREYFGVTPANYRDNGDA